MDGVHRSPRRHRFNRRRQRRRSGVDTAASSQSDGMDSYVKTSSTADFLEHLLKYRRRPAKTSDPGTLFFFCLINHSRTELYHVDLYAIVSFFFCNAHWQWWLGFFS